MNGIGQRRSDGLDGIRDYYAQPNLLLLLIQSKGGLPIQPGQSFRNAKNVRVKVTGIEVLP